MGIAKITCRSNTQAVVSRKNYRCVCALRGAETGLAQNCLDVTHGSWQGHEPSNGVWIMRTHDVHVCICTVNMLCGLLLDSLMLVLAAGNLQGDAQSAQAWRTRSDELLKQMFPDKRQDMQTSSVSFLASTVDHGIVVARLIDKFLRDFCFCCH